MGGFVAFTLVAAVAAPATATVAVPAPVIVAAPPAPVVLAERAADFPPATLAVSILAGRAPLWNGSLRVGGRYNSSVYSQAKNEPPPLCPGQVPDQRGYSTNNDRLELRLERRRSAERPDAFVVSVTWSRPLSDCQGEGASTIGLTRVVDLVPGQTIDLQGDGGLMVRVTRRD